MPDAAPYHERCRRRGWVTRRCKERFIQTDGNSRDAPYWRVQGIEPFTRPRKGKPLPCPSPLGNESMLRIRQPNATVLRRIEQRGGGMVDDTGSTAQSEALRMVDTFASVGVTQFDIAPHQHRSGETRLSQSANLAPDQNLPAVSSGFGPAPPEQCHPPAAPSPRRCSRAVGRPRSEAARACPPCCLFGSANEPRQPSGMGGGGGRRPRVCQPPEERHAGRPYGQRFGPRGRKLQLQAQVRAEFPHGDD